MLLVLGLPLKAGQRGEPENPEQLWIEQPHVRCLEVALCSFFFSSNYKVLVHPLLRIEEDVDTGQLWFGANLVARVVQRIRWNAGSF